MLEFVWHWMAISEQKLSGVVFHSESAVAGFLFPFEINACIFLPFPVGSDRVVFLKCGEEMLCMMFAHTFDAKMIDG